MLVTIVAHGYVVKLNVAVDNVATGY